MLTSRTGLNDRVVTWSAILRLISLTLLDFFDVYGCLCYHLAQTLFFFFPVVFPKDISLEKFWWAPVIYFLVDLQIGSENEILFLPVHVFSIVNKEKYLNLVNFPLQGQVSFVSLFPIQNWHFYDHDKGKIVSLHVLKHEIRLLGCL